eukprot:1151295-Pelagomonas_calceolata.AAC.1
MPTSPSSAAAACQVRLPILIPLAVNQQQPMSKASGASSRRRRGARGCRRRIWCRSGPGSAAVEREFRGGVSQHGSA